MSELTFKASKPLTLGIELEWQILDPKTNALKAQSIPLLEEIGLYGGAIAEQFKPEGMRNMIEINSTVHEQPYSILEELYARQDELSKILQKLDIALAGGGTHPFELWKNREIFPKERYAKLHEIYGFLYKRFSVYGQHIHIGCATAEEALYLTLAFAEYVPHFIALSAASPYYMGVDTHFDCSRLTVVSAFPTSGVMPYMETWQEFEAHYAEMSKFRLVNSIKDLYWDIRPKPEFGTVELRICDSPLRLDRAVALAAYAQALAAYLLEHRPSIGKSLYTPYQYNRFSAMRYGMNAKMMDIDKDQETPLDEEILATLEKIWPYAKTFQSESFLEILKKGCEAKKTEADQLRQVFDETQSFEALIQYAMQEWRAR